MLAKEICTIIAAGNKSNVAKLEYNGLIIEYKTGDTVKAEVSQIPIQFSLPEATEENYQEQEPTHSEHSYEDLLITDPELYEEKLLAKSGET